MPLTWLPHHPLSPDLAVVALTAGVLLIYWELNRPGMVLPGAAGLLIALLAVASLSRHTFNPLGVLLALAAGIVLALQLRYALPLLISVAATVMLFIGLLFLVSREASPHVHAPAAACGILLGAGTTALTRIARRARRNKAVN